MAITPNRLNVETIRSLNKVNFEDKKDEIIINDPTKPQVGPTNVAAKKLANDEAPKHAIVNTPSNSIYDGSVSMPKSKKDILSKKHVSNTDELITTSDINDLLTKKNADGIIKLTPASDAKLENMISTKLKTAKKTYPTINVTDMTKNVKSTVISNLSKNVGDTIKSKANLLNSLDRCIGINDLDISLNLNNLIDLSILDAISCSGIKNFISGIGDFIGGLGTLAKSMIEPNGTKIVDKLLFSKVLKDTIPTAAEQVMGNLATKGTIRDVLSNLKDSDYKSNSSSSTFTDVTAGLDSYDPEWKTDDLGEVNYFKVKDNDFLIGNAINMNKNKMTMPTVATNNINTNYDESLLMSIVSV